MKLGEKVEFKRDGLHGVGVVIKVNSYYDEYQVLVRITETYNNTPIVRIGDIWGIDTRDLVNQDKNLILQALELVKSTSVESNCPAKATAVAALVELLENVSRDT